MKHKRISFISHLRFNLCNEDLGVQEIVKLFTVFPLQQPLRAESDNMINFTTEETL